MRRLLLQRLLEPSKAATLTLEGNGRRLFHPGQYGGHSKPTQLKTEIQPQFVTDTLQNGATSFISFDAKTPVSKFIDPLIMMILIGQAKFILVKCLKLHRETWAKR